MSDNYTQDFIDEVKGALNSGSSGGESSSGVDQTARDAIKKHSDNGDIHHTEDEIKALSGGSKLVMLTKAEFDALIAAGTDDHDVYYVITDMGGDDGILASLLAEADPDTFTAEVN